VRRPSQTTVAPAVVDQWYESVTGFGPAASHGKLPLFVMMIGTVVVVVAMAALGMPEL
jgi:hypothetical protein